MLSMALGGGLTSPPPYAILPMMELDGIDRAKTAVYE
jgi:hypothetical protein